MNAQNPTFRPIHPFPARMAPSIIQRRLKTRKSMCVVDPMSGSGTTVLAARFYGHQAFGFDTDPLALLIARASSADLVPDRLRKLASRVLIEAKESALLLSLGTAYPTGANAESRAFIRFWFDGTNRRQLTALSTSIAKIKDAHARAVLWCAFSRMIITKEAGVSLAMDVSHSRPHKVFRVAPKKPFEHFMSSLDRVLDASHFLSGLKLPLASIRRADARKLPLRDHSVDIVITSPPYLNAIDYLRGHKMSLVWMGYQVDALRALRAGNIGTERLHSVPVLPTHHQPLDKVVHGFDRLPARTQDMLIQYFFDMSSVLAEIARILKPFGEAVVVVGNSTIRGIFINTSKMLTIIAREHGLRLTSKRRRELQENRRYLPPPGRAGSGAMLMSRMNEEVILAFRKTALTASGRQ